MTRKLLARVCDDLVDEVWQDLVEKKYKDIEEAVHSINARIYGENEK